MGGAGTGLVEGQPFPSAFTQFLVQVVIIIAMSKAVQRLLRPFSQPAVVSEMLAGIFLGPTVMGRMPGFTEHLFPPASVSILAVISSFGLCFYMFMVGLELDPDMVKKELRTCVLISGTGLLVPFVASLLLAIVFNQPAYVPSNSNFGVLSLFLTCALGISALPVMARILTEKDMLHTRLGGLSLCIAAVDDVAAWILLAICIAVVRANNQLDILYVLLLSIAECLGMWYLIRPLLAGLVYGTLPSPWVWLRQKVRLPAWMSGLRIPLPQSRGRRARPDAGRSGVSAPVPGAAGWPGHEVSDTVSDDVILALCLILVACCWFTEVIGLSSLIGAFQVGLLVPRHGSISHQVVAKFEWFIVAILMPLFFCNSGLKTQFGLINSWELFGLSVALIVVATLAKVIGITAPCVYLGIPPRMSLAIGILMNCKGLVAVIVVNLANDYGVITPTFFAILVLMILVATMITVPLVQLLDLNGIGTGTGGAGEVPGRGQRGASPQQVKHAASNALGKELAAVALEVAVGVDESGVKVQSDGGKHVGPSGPSPVLTARAETSSTITTTEPGSSSSTPIGHSSAVSMLPGSSVSRPLAGQGPLSGHSSSNSGEADMATHVSNPVHGREHGAPVPGPAATASPGQQRQVVIVQGRQAAAIIKAGQAQEQAAKDKASDAATGKDSSAMSPLSFLGMALGMNGGARTSPTTASSASVSAATTGQPGPATAQGVVGKAVKGEQLNPLAMLSATPVVVAIEAPSIVLTGTAAAAGQAAGAVRLDLPRPGTPGEGQGGTDGQAMVSGPPTDALTTVFLSVPPPPAPIADSLAGSLPLPGPPPRPPPLGPDGSQQ